MKKRYFLTNISFGTLLFLFFILFGCMEEDNFPSHHEGNQRLSAHIVKESPGTRTTLRDNPTNQKVEVKWKEGDAIGVFGSQSGKNVRYQTSQSFISEDGRSTVFETTETAAAEGDLTVYYPYQQGATYTAGGVLHLTMPQSQLYNTEQTGITQPHPAANIMAGKGKDGSIAFRNLFAILRVNIAGSDGQMVKKVLFTDLSGRPVSGSFSVTWSGDIPTAKFPDTGSGPDLQIELDCGDGVELAKNSLTKFFMIVPARNYSKGFQVDFVLANGEKITKTIGASGGKVLLRSMLYPIGDMFPNQDDKISYTFKNDVSVMSDERYDLIDKALLDTASYKLTLTVDEGFAPIKDEIIIINQLSTTLPKGYVGKVKTTDGTTVVMEPTKSIDQLFTQLSVGDPIWSSAGGANEAGGYAIDLSQYITSIETFDGKPVSFAIDGSSISMQVPYPMAEAEVDTKFSLPSLSHTFSIVDQEKYPNCSCGVEFGVQMDLALYFHILVGVWGINDLQCRVNPTINLWSTSNIDWVTDPKAFGTEIPFVVIRTAPIPAGPILIIPLIEFYLTFDLNGKIGLSAQLAYSEEFSFGLSYHDYELSSYGHVVQKESKESPISFNSSLHLEGGFAVGVAPKVGFTLWEIIRLDTRLYSKVNTSASISFDSSETFFDSSFYSKIYNAKLSSDLQMYMTGGIYVWRDRKLAATESTTLKYPLWEAYIVPWFQKFTVKSSKNEVAVEIDVSRKVFFDTKIGLIFYAQNKETGQFTINAGTVELCDYKEPPDGESVYKLKETKRISLQPGAYQVRPTAILDAPGGPYTIEANLMKNIVIPHNNPITITTDKQVGEMFYINIDFEELNASDNWVDINDNGFFDEGEKRASWSDFVLQSQTFSIYGSPNQVRTNNERVISVNASGCTSIQSIDIYKSDVLTSVDVSGCNDLSSLSCGSEQLTSLDVTGCVALASLQCPVSKLTSLDLSSCKKLEILSCFDNQLTSLDVSGCDLLSSLYCSGNKLTSLNISGCKKLWYLECNENQLPSLDLSSCTALGELMCSKNKVSIAINASNLKNLTKVYCINSQATELNLRGSTALISVTCHDNQISSLEVSGSSKLNTLECYNNLLSTLNVEGCTALKKLKCKNNGLLGTPPSVFKDIAILEYDIRYRYQYDGKTNKYVMIEDTGKGYWYAHEPEGGCHSPEPCN